MTGDIEGVRYTHSVRRGFEPDFASERSTFPAAGPANGFTVQAREYRASGGRPGFTSTDIGAYDEAGLLVGTFSVAHGADQDGFFKISVRPDAMRQGWGMRLLDRAAQEGIDLADIAARNIYTSAGRALLLRWLEERAAA